MKNLLSIFVLCCAILTSNNAQNTSNANFTTRMNNHITRYFSDETNLAKAKALYGHTCDKNHIVTEEEIKARAEEAEKHVFIKDNMEEYLRLYFPQTANRSVLTDTFVCDNGGFEDDFLYYRGFVSTYTTGSNTCTPNVSSWTPVTMPVNNRFAIVSSGVDPLIGINKTKFGNKALKINSEFGHTSDCAGNLGIDKLVKRFKVTEENLDFTVWYAVALENPFGHMNQQPFFSIKCDLAPQSNLCFDADILQCAQLYESKCEYDSIDVLNWSCQRIKIPSSEIGNIATVEITMADCGQSAHFGYAYIDGFCEDCIGSSLGAGTFYDQQFDGEIGIDYDNCSGGLLDTIAKVCGRYSLPSLCNDFWSLDSIILQGFPNIAITIDTLEKTFCFEIPLSFFNNEDCLDLVAELYFSSPTNFIPVQYTNTLKICSKYYYDYQYQSYVSQCYNNGTPENISDDYYFVNVIVSNANGDTWNMSKQLLDPYPNESGFQNLANGSGNTNLNFGPFLIQDGSWNLSLAFPIYCTFNEIINPPPYCSGCENFYGLQISNIQCRNVTTPNTWSFDISVPGSGLYDVKIIGGGTVLSGVSYNSNHSIYAGNIDVECITYEIRDKNDPNCFSEFTVCPPKPCPVENDCNLEVSVSKKECINENGDFTITLNTLNSGGGYVCYTIDNFVSTTPMPVNGEIGPFSQDVTLVVFVCPYSNCKNCNSPTCFKVIEIFEPDCESGHFGNGGLPRLSNIKDIKNDMIKIVPNPVNSNILRITSTSQENDIEIYNIASQLIHKTKFEGIEYLWNMSHLPSGTYVLKYLDKNQNIHSIKFIK